MNEIAQISGLAGAPVIRKIPPGPTRVERSKALIDRMACPVVCIQCLWIPQGNAFALEIAAIFGGHGYYSVCSLGGPSSDLDGPLRAEVLPPWLELHSGVHTAQELASLYGIELYCPGTPSRRNEGEAWWELDKPPMAAS